MTESRTLITGATGSIGRFLVDRFASGPASFTVMCRRPEQVREFESRGVAAVLGDLDDPSGLRRVLRGFDQLFLVPPGGADEGDQLRRERGAIDAAVAEGVQQVVKISAADANPHSPIPWARDHGRSDAYLQRSGLSNTRLRPSAFMTNLLDLAPVVRRGWLPNPSGHGSATWIAPRDIADAAYAVLTDRSQQGGPGEEGLDLLLTGTQPLSFPQIAAIMTERLGRTVRTLPAPAPLVYAGMRLGGAPHWQAAGMVQQFGTVVRRGLDNVRVHSTTLAALIGREPIDLPTFVDDHREVFDGRRQVAGAPAWG